MLRKIDGICLFALLVIIGLRPLIGECYSSAIQPMSGVTNLIDPTPLRTLLFDTAILVVVLIHGVSRIVSRQSYRWCGIEIGLAVVGLAGVISCLFAGNQRIALNAAIDWVCTASIAILLAQLLQRPWQIRLALCLVMATAAAMAAECYNQKFVTFEDSYQNYLENKETIWKEQGVPLDSSRVRMFEQRMKAREASGYFWHSNIAGAYLILGIFCAGALVVTRLADDSHPPEWGFGLATGIVALSLTGALWITNSLGALVGLFVGVGLLILAFLSRRWNDLRRFHLIWTATIVGFIAVTGLGLVSRGLPGASLNFRWQYWVGSLQMATDHLLTGVGMENFGNHYLQYKSIEWPEEVSNPHNFLVSALTDWGIPGLIGILLMLWGGSKVLLVPPARREELADETTPSGRLIPWMLLLGAGIFWTRTFLLDSDDPSYIYFFTAFPLLFWVPAFAIGGLSAGSLMNPMRNTPLPKAASTVLICGLAGFIASDLINFSLLIPGTITTFFALLGIAISLRTPPSTQVEQQRLPNPGLVGAVGGVAILAFLGFTVLPVARSREHLLAARELLNSVEARPPSNQPFFDEYTQAATADRLDPTPLSECAGVVFRLSEGAPFESESLGDVAEGLLNAAILRDPYKIQFRRLKMQLMKRRGELDMTDDLAAKIARAADGPVSLYPESPKDYADRGELLLWLGETTGNKTYVQTALTALERALALDHQRPEWEVMRRFSDSRRAGIEKAIAKAQQFIAQSTQPATQTGGNEDTKKP